MLTTILPQIAIACCAAAAAIYLAKAKRNAPISRKDADILWKLHKQTGKCASHKWQPLTEQRSGEMTGFQCQCGYRYTQKRPVLSKTPIKTVANVSAPFHARAFSASKVAAVQLDPSQL